MTAVERRCSARAASAARRGRAAVAYIGAIFRFVIITFCFVLLIPASQTYSAGAMASPACPLGLSVSSAMSPSALRADMVVPERDERTRLVDFLRAHAAIADQLVPAAYAMNVGRAGQSIADHAATTIAGAPVVRVDRRR